VKPRNCKSIASYKTKEEASEAAMRSTYKPLLRYQCERCGMWHLSRVVHKQQGFRLPNSN